MALDRVCLGSIRKRAQDTQVANRQRAFRVKKQICPVHRAVYQVHYLRAEVFSRMYTSPYSISDVCCVSCAISPPFRPVTSPCFILPLYASKTYRTHVQRLTEHCSRCVWVTHLYICKLNKLSIVDVLIVNLLCSGVWEDRFLDLRIELSKLWESLCWHARCIVLCILELQGKSRGGQLRPKRGKLYYALRLMCPKLASSKYISCIVYLNMLVY